MEFYTLNITTTILIVNEVLVFSLHWSGICSNSRRMWNEYLYW